jgi:hypothetical protein
MGTPVWVNRDRLLPQKLGFQILTIERDALFRKTALSMALGFLYPSVLH